MFGFETRSRSDIADRIDTLRHEIARLSEDVASGARDRGRYASRHAASAVDELAEQAERLGARAGEMIASGLAAARRGRREADGNSLMWQIGPRIWCNGIQQPLPWLHWASASQQFIW